MKKLKDAEFEHTTPESVGVKSSSVKAFIDEINAKGLNVHSFTMVRHGKIFAQCFWAPYNRETPHVLYSMSKSVTSTAIGFCVSEGLISLDDKISKFFPEYKSAKLPVNNNLTVRMLLTMRSDKLITVFENKGGTDWIKNYFHAPFLAPPDTKFNYISENTYMLSAIVSRVTGMNVIDYLYPRLLEPLGIEKPFWETDKNGVCAGGWGLYMKSEDLAKFFYPYLHEGKYKDSTQLIPEFWVKEATAKQTESVADSYIDNVNGYGFQFWRNPIANSYRADGLYGQRCFFLPDYDAMIVMNCGHAQDYEVMKVFWKHFPSAFEYEALEENEKDYAELRKTAEACSVKQPIIHPRNYEAEKRINNRTIECKTSEFVSVVSISVTQMLYNKPGKINMMRFNFTDDNLLFTWREKEYENTIEVGLNGEYGISPMRLGDLNYTAYSKASWQSDGSLKLWIRPIQTAHVRIFTFYFNSDNTVKIINEMDPKFKDLAVYSVVFSGHEIVFKSTEELIKGAVDLFGIPLIEPDFTGRFTD